ncbi:MULTISPECIES: SigE family RNA polymerase sigma factor [Amycolatopsis]|uniref:RNA polymerase subunit sigma-24 n=1 Tax=Amycolatopsis albispora TaxID=1804986 RepID=A0A344LEJ7_9PSEU|nr:MULTISPECIES: SigE family RNA polymerase sigma factor [Amycolatopsis]AXB46471.1 RNA polymerase subunit sigma-24 [Amycolatopsis albispora]MBN6035866.1 SigE family RNA polymerase sigma factor [Amycolatopsis sp. 195334CR]QFU94448.1 RNA polymerase sigma-E factor [Amycolatopsis sp. YIM 10]
MDQREEQEFAEYFAAKRDSVRRTAYMLCGDWHRADDLAQTAFVSLHRRWRKIRDRAATDAYLRKTLVRASIDESRRPWRRERQVEELPEPAVQSGPRLDEQVATREDLLAGLRGVPSRQRAVLVLRYFEGLDVSGVAKALGCSEGTVKSQTARGLENLRKVLGGLGEEVDSRG